MTMMVRDEIDIIAAMIEHHLAQGIDLFIVTDNGSIDGTYELLQGYAVRGVLELHLDPVQHKQQHRIVTEMARRAYTVHHADWVINADADEFWVAKNPAIRLRTAFENIDTGIRSFEVPVIDMTGLPARDGSGLGRMIYRDNRSIAELKDIGLQAHSTPDAVHVGTADVQVVQGNHSVSLASQGDPDPQWAIEVLHLPWRSWNQFRQKVENSGRAYNANPELSPSPNHHGMREFHRFTCGALLPFYVLRHPTPAELQLGLESGVFQRDDRLLGLVKFGVPDEGFDPEQEKTDRKYGAILLAAERDAERTDREHREAAELREQQYKTELDRAKAEASEAVRRIEALEAHSAHELALRDTHILELEARIDEFSARKVVRLADKTATLRNWIRPGTTKQ
ncbi:glycosyltransferase family 2 protein [Cryobacterium zhongshanensis]|uniref:Glycosyltransferase family 2 protein n=1 Tax=Cryobacterium zhongshanensis TaxID=2928153 RepID=A0AA41QW14_9MICO|nr:glycosyltransferase family 2 protein [Cryobacterium zhongshanensis]MCI4658395.1 glycosyltransferase family 2 protein [Cryobacterium zhongshanensis]